jgi:DNA-binding MarR family transcriptional regulator
MPKPSLQAAPETSTTPGESLPLDSSLFFKLVRVVNLTARPFHAGMGNAHQITLNEWRAMVVVASHPGSAATDIAEATGLDKMSVSRALAGLRRLDRVQLKSDATDQRRSHVYLSKAGRRVFEQIGASAMQREAELFSGVSAQELQAMSSTLDKLVLALKATEAK